MQSEAPEAVDLSRETAETKALYGLDDARCKDFGAMCLRARRLVERGVRFVQLYCGSGSQWDAHRDLEGNHGSSAPAATGRSPRLIPDLKRRGLLDETLVVWGGEFGRTPMNEGSDGRDHNPYGFSMFLAGGGIKGGPDLRHDRRVRPARRRGPGPRPRPARHDPAPARPRPPAA